MSEFGTGYAYCLGLFLAHAERDIGPNKSRAGLALYGAADHIFELQIPEALSEEQKNKAEAFKDLVLTQRLDLDIPVKKWMALLQTAKDLLLEWDIICGIKAEKGDYE
jgi:hypothetical protein